MAHYRTKTGTIRAYWLALLICVAAFMQGYDSGVAGGVLTMQPFEDDYRYPKSQKTRVNSLSVGMLQLGAFLASFIIYPITAKVGRRYAIMGSSLVFCVGTIIQTINTHSLTAWYFGRLISGFGQGGVSVVVPTFNAEMSPKEIRGRLASIYQWMYTLGIFTSYWTDYGVVRGIDNIPRQWQIPVSMQMIAAGILFIGTFTLKESVRWLVKKDRFDEAWESLVWVRGDDSDATLAEFEEIKDGVRTEFVVTQGLTWRELLMPANRYRVFLANIIFVFQQATGATALAYFGPQFFELLVGPGDKDLLLTALFGAVKVVACTLFILFVADLFGRRVFFMGGGLGMAACMLCTALVYKFKPPPGDGTITSAGIATIALLYLNVSFYNWSWGTVPWAYVPEIFPTRIREIGVASALATHWLFAFVFSISTPYMIRDMGWGTFLFYACMDVIMSVFTFFFIKETRGKSLESMEQVFNSEIANAPKNVEDEAAYDARAAKVV